MLECIDNRISIRRLRISTIIGVYAHERTMRQEIVCNLDLKLKPKAIFRSDNLCDTVDYAAVAKCLTDWIGAQKSQLIEDLAHGAIQTVFEMDPRICSVRLELFKPGCIANAEGAAVELHYLRSEPYSESTGIDRRLSTKCFA